MNDHDEHLHSHEGYTHSHTHDHHHAAQQNISPKKLLESMYAHNGGHMDELCAVADMLNEEAKAKVLEAVEVLKKGNDILGEAIRSIKED